MDSHLKREDHALSAIAHANALLADLHEALTALTTIQQEQTHRLSALQRQLLEEENRNAILETELGQTRMQRDEARAIAQHR